MKHRGGASNCWVLLALFFLHPVRGQARVIDDLQEIRSAIVDDPLDLFGTWVNEEYCLWDGVACDGLNNVVGLKLNASELKGSISPFIGNLTFLEYLDLSGNNLSGGIPTEIGRLPALVNLTLYQNSLSGTIPDNLGSSGSLIHLDLSANKLGGSIPASICISVHLRTLNLAGNNGLVGKLPRNIDLCAELQRLLLSNNLLDGAIPESVGKLPNLQILDLSNNRFVGPVPHNFTQDHLELLNLEGNQLSGNLSAGLGNLSSLALLNLGGNSLEGAIPSELGHLRHLNTLHLGRNMLNGHIPSSFSNLSLLYKLDLSNNILEGGIPIELGQLGNLSSLILANNHLSGSIPPSLKGCEKLIQLELGNNQLSGQIPPEIGGLVNLQYGLNLSWNNLSGPIPKELGNLTRLTVLDLSHNNLAGPIPTSLGNLPSLLNIDLSYNNLSGTVPPFKTMVNASQFADNPNLCFGTKCSSGSGQASGEMRRGLPTWAAIVVGVGVALVLLIVGGIIACYWRFHFQYTPPEAEVKVQSTEGRLFIDPEGQSFTFEDVLAATQRITDSDLVGTGRFSTVYRVIMPSGIALAAKKLKVDTENSVLSRKFLSELSKIEKMRHHNILRVLGYVLRGDSLLLLYQYMPNGSLGEWLHRRPESVLEWNTRFRVAVGSAQGLSYLHHHCHPPFVHRDVNSNNVLLDSMFEPHLGDVGLAKLYDPSKDTESMTAVAGSFGYIAPEYAYTMRVTEKSNVYSFGVILLEILTGRDPVERTFGEGLDLVSWVHTAGDRNETQEQLLDPAVSTASFPVRQEMLAVLKVAKLCTSTLPSERPRMKTVVELLHKCKQVVVQAAQIQKQQ